MDLFETVREALIALRENRLRSALTMLGVVVGVGAVILLVSLGEGTTAFVKSEFSSMGSNLLILQPGKQETKGMAMPMPTARKLTLEDTEAIRRHARFVAAVAPLVIASTTASHGGLKRSVMCIGTDAEWTVVLNLRPQLGRFLDDTDDASGRHVVVLGRKIAADLFGDADPLGAPIELAGARFRVAGVMEPKGNALGNNFDEMVYIPTRVAMRTFGIDSLIGLRARATSRELLDEAAAEMLRVVRERHRVEDVTVLTQDEFMRTLDRIMGVLTTLLASIAAISLVVGGIGIMNIMLVSVKERTREIGLRKAVGARRRDILFQFLVESATLSLLGGAIGAAFGIGLPLLAHLASDQIPAVFTPWGVALALLFSIGVGLGFGVYPALQASALRPIEALRHE